MVARNPLPLRKVTIRLDARDWALITASVGEGNANEVARTLLHAYAERLRRAGVGSGSS